jgi:hypothetical protein
MMIRGMMMGRVVVGRGAEELGWTTRPLKEAHEEPLPGLKLEFKDSLRTKAGPCNVATNDQGL